MADLVVTVPKKLWPDWLAEGALPGQPCPPDTEYHWFLRGTHPPIHPGERLYITAHGRLRGYAPVVRVENLEMAMMRWHADMKAFGAHARTVPSPDTWWWEAATWSIVRQGGAVAVTVPWGMPGFQGWRYVQWKRDEEIPFPAWQTKGVR